MSKESGRRVSEMNLSFDADEDENRAKNKFLFAVLYKPGSKTFFGSKTVRRKIIRSFFEFWLQFSCKSNSAISQILLNKGDKSLMKTKTTQANDNRRDFLKKFGGAAAATVAVAAGAVPVLAQTSDKKILANEKNAVEAGALTRKEICRQIRIDAAQREFEEPEVVNAPNGDEQAYPNRIGNYSKALPHNPLGEVDLSAYAALITAVNSGLPADYAAIPLGGTTKLANPQAALAFPIEGADVAHLNCPAPPALSSALEGAEMAEVYWHALTRDIPFSQYAENSTVTAATRDLRRFATFRWLTETTMFRGETFGDSVGPYISQFLCKPIPYGATTIEQRYRVPVADDDKMTGYSEWLNIQNGLAPSSSQIYDPTPRYIRNGRDLGEFVHQDFSFQAFLNAALILLSYGGAALSDTNPYKTIANQGAFAQFGGPHILDMVARAANAGLKAAWYQKWNVHRRLRPEAFAGLVHNHATGNASYPMVEAVLHSAAVSGVFSLYGTYLLPMAFPEGSPTHPAYPAGHATISGACATILKAFFKESFAIPNPVEANADGLSLNAYSGQLTAGQEINKLAANISLGRDMAGVHWRSDGIEGMNLGEKVAIQILKDYRQTYNEDFAGFTFTKFDGTTKTI